MLAEVRVGRIVEAIGRWRSGALSCGEAAEVLGMSERHFRRLRDRYEAQGAEGLIDRRRGRVSGRRVPVDRIEWLLEQYRTRYFDFTVKHFHERLRARAQVRAWLQLDQAHLAGRGPGQAGGEALGAPQEAAASAIAGHDAVPGRLDPRLARRPAGARPDRHPRRCDQRAIYSAFLVEEEGTFSSFRGLAEVIAAHGLFCALYTDRGATIS